MDKFDLRKYITEGKLIKENQELTDLVDELRSAKDPDNEYHDYEGREPDEILNDIRSKFGDKIADQVSYSGETSGWGKTYPDEGDKLKSKQSHFDIIPNITTKSGKMHKGSVNKMKNYYKRGY